MGKRKSKYDLPNKDSFKDINLLDRVKRERKYTPMDMSGLLPPTPEESKEEKERMFWIDLVTQLKDNLEDYLKSTRKLKGDKENKELTAEIGRAYTLTPQELVDKGVDYFVKCINKDMPITMSGLSLALKVSIKQLNYYDWNIGKSKSKTPIFSYIISQLKTFVGLYYETQAHNKKMGSTQFYIFALKNMDWKDKVEVEDSENARAFDTKTASRIREHFRRLNLNPKKNNNASNSEKSVSDVKGEN